MGLRVGGCSVLMCRWSTEGFKNFGDLDVVSVLYWVFFLGFLSQCFESLERIGNG